MSSLKRLATGSRFINRRNHSLFSTATTTTTKKKHQIISLDGDGIGPELMQSTKEIISAATDSSDFEIIWINMPFGYALYQQKGYSITKDHLDAFNEHRILLKGPITVPSGDTSFTIDNLGTGKSYTSPNQALRKIFDLYGHVRPAKSYKNSPFKVTHAHTHHFTYIFYAVH